MDILKYLSKRHWSPREDGGNPVDGGSPQLSDIAFEKTYDRGYTCPLCFWSAAWQYRGICRNCGEELRVATIGTVWASLGTGDKKVRRCVDVSFHKWPDQEAIDNQYFT